MEHPLKNNELENEKKPKKMKMISRKPKWYVWPIKILFLAFSLSLVFSIVSEYVMSATGIIISTLIILFLMAISVVTDMVGVAVTACSAEPFTAMASKKVKGAKEALVLIKNADKVASLCADVMGDVCGILSGAAGAAIVVKITSNMTINAAMILVASLVSSAIAALTIFGKALGKKFSIEKCNQIVLIVGKILSPFHSRKEKKLKDKISAKNQNGEVIKK